MKKRIFYGWFVLAASFVTLVLGYGIRNTFSVFYPAIVEEFGWGRGNTALMLFFTRLSPFFPASVINMGSGAMGIKSPLFAITTFLGSLPLVLAYTLIGKHLGTIVQISDIYDQNLTILLVSLGLLSFSPLLKKDIRAMLAEKYRRPRMSLLTAPVRGLQAISKKFFSPLPLLNAKFKCSEY